MIGALAAVLAICAVVVGAPWHLFGREIGRLSVLLGAPLLAMVFGLLPFRRFRRWAVACLRSETQLSSRAAGLLVFAVVGFSAKVVVNRWRSLGVNAFDFSMLFDRPIERSLHGQLLYSDLLHGSIFGDHFRPFLLILVPFYAIVATPRWLLAVQIIAIAGGAVGAFVLFRRQLHDDSAALALAGGFLLNSYNARAAQYIFHLEVLYPMALFLVVFAYVSARPWLFGIALVLTGSIKEDCVIPLIGIAIAAALERRFRWSAGAAGVGLAAYFFFAFVLAPRFGGRPAGSPWYSQYWGQFGPEPAAALVGMVSRPGQVIHNFVRSGVIDILETAAFVPLMGGVWFLAAIPGLLILGVSNMAKISHFALYYSMPVLPLIFASIPAGLRRLSRVSRTRVSEEKRRGRIRLGACVVLLVSAFDGAGFSFERARPEGRFVSELLRHVPVSVPVLVQSSLLPRAGYDRSFVVLADNSPPDGRHAFLLDPGTDGYPLTSAAISSLAGRTLADPRYLLLARSGSLLLFVPRERVDRSGARRKWN